MSYNKETGMYEGYIYKITNNINNKIYIGQTTVNINTRWSQHKSSSKDETYPLYKAMRKYGVSNFTIEEVRKVICDTLENTVKELNNLEEYYISYYDSLMPYGYNLTPGGDNSSINLVRPVNAYNASGTLCFQFNSIIEAANCLSNKSHHGISLCCKGEAQSALGYIWRYKEDSFDLFPINITQEQLDRENNKISVDQYDLNGNFIKNYESMSEALKSVNGKGVTNIVRCINGICRQGYGYVWRKKGEPYNKYQFSEPKNKTSIDVYSFTTKEYINTYSFINEGVKELGLNDCHSLIVLNCTGRVNQVCGYVFRYQGDSFDKYGDPTKKKSKTNKIIYKYNLDGQFLYGIKSARSEAKENHCNPNNILFSCRGLRPNNPHEYNNYLWFYSDDPDQPDKSRIMTKEEYLKS